MATTFAIDFNGATAGNNTTNYNDLAVTNPTVLLFSGAQIALGNSGAANRLKTLVLHIANPSGTMTFSLNATAQAAATAAGITLSFNSVTGNITLTGASGVTETNWNTILDGLQYNNSADEPLLTNHAITLVSATPSSGSYTSATASNTETLTVICFMPGTMIATPDGEAAVETLQPGDLVLTSTGEIKPINWIGRQTVSKRFADPLRSYPIRVRAGALDDNAPTRDLYVSPDHALLVGDVMVNAGALVNGTSITREKTIPDTFVYYHVELDDHSFVLAEGAPAETFVDNIDRMNFDNWSEYQALYPEGKTVAELPYPRAKSHRQVPVHLRVKLAERAQRIGEQDATQVA